MCSRNTVGGPRVGRLVRSDVSVARDQRAHARRDAGRDVALGVADVHASRRCDGERVRRVQQRVGMRLRARRGIAADDDARSRREAERGDDGPGEPRRLVRHDAPPQRARLDRVEHVGDALEQHRVDGERRFVAGEERGVQRRELGVAGRYAERRTEETARAVRCMRTQLGERHRLEPAVGAQPVDGGAEVRRRVGQRAIEIEQNGVDVERARRARVSRHRGRTPSGSSRRCCG